MITTAMVLAAGLGKRMRPLTETMPKPMVPVAGRTLIDRALDRLVEAGVTRAVVNVHYLADQLLAHLKDRKDLEIVISDETDALLETGGGLKRALPLIEDDDFFVVNSDSLWLNGLEDALKRLHDGWDDEALDALLLLQQTVYAFGYDGLGDFQLGSAGDIMRRPESEVVPYVFMGVQILHKRLFDDLPDQCLAPKFSLNPLYDRAIEAGRIGGVLHDGEWFHVGTPADREVAETFLNQRYAGRERR